MLYYSAKRGILTQAASRQWQHKPNDRREYHWTRNNQAHVLALAVFYVMKRLPLWNRMKDREVTHSSLLLGYAIAHVEDITARSFIHLIHSHWILHLIVIASKYRPSIAVG